MSRHPANLWQATASFTLGIIACSLNLLVITAPLGLFLGLLAFIFALIGWFRYRAAFAGLVLSLFSFLMLVIYAATYALIYPFDPSVISWF